MAITQTVGTGSVAHFDIDMNQRDLIALRAFEVAIRRLVELWTDPEFWKDYGARMDSNDCAKAIQPLLDALPHLGDPIIVQLDPSGEA